MHMGEEKSRDDFHELLKLEIHNTNRKKTCRTKIIIAGVLKGRFALIYISISLIKNYFSLKLSHIYRLLKSSRCIAHNNQKFDNATLRVSIRLRTELDLAN